MWTRREMLQRAAQLGALAGLPLGSKCAVAQGGKGLFVNDAQSQLNLTRVHKIVQPTTLDDIVTGITTAAREGRAISVAGGRHAMGGQQFGEDTYLFERATSPSQPAIHSGCLEKSSLPIR